MLEAPIERSNLFKKYQDIARLSKPNPLITKPIFCVMALKGTLVFTPSTNWNNIEDLNGIWAKNKNQIKKPGFLTDLHNFDIRSVTPEQNKIVRRILNDGWMQ